MVYASGAAGFVVVLANGASYSFPTLNNAIRQAIGLEMAFGKVVAINTPTRALAGANLRKLIGEEPPGYGPFPMGGSSAARNPLAAEEYRERKAEILRRHEEGVPRGNRTSHQPD